MKILFDLILVLMIMAPLLGAIAEGIVFSKTSKESLDLTED